MARKGGWGRKVVVKKTVRERPIVINGGTGDVRVYSLGTFGLLNTLYLPYNMYTMLREKDRRKGLEDYMHERV